MSSKWANPSSAGPPKRLAPPARKVHKLQPSQSLLSNREVKQILVSCKASFNADMKIKRMSLSPNSDRTLRAKTLNSKVEKKSQNGETAMKKIKSAPNSPHSVSFSMLEDILHDSVTQKSPQKSNKNCNSAPVSPNDNKKRRSSSNNSSNQESIPKKLKLDGELTPSPQAKSKRSTLLSAVKQRKKAPPMDEVMKLQQDEGVMHLLHALPTSRRKTQTSLFNSSSYNNASTNHTNKSLFLATYNGRMSSNNGHNAIGARKPNKRSAKKDYLIKVRSQDVKSVTPDDLMNPKTLEALRKLPQKEYINLWSSNSRYKLSEEALGLCNSEPQTLLRKQSSVSPDSSVGSDISSASTLTATITALSGQSKRIGDRMLLNTTTINKQFKDILVRSYPNFATILLSPISTGMRSSFNVNMFEEIIEVMNILKDTKGCKAVVFTGVGGTFSQGIDLTTLTHESSEKQRKSAEAMANGIKNFIKCLLNYPKLLVAALNGATCGLGVTVLPFMDFVYANDKAILSCNYGKLGQIPEAFASVTMPPMVMNELVILGKGLTAEQAEQKGLISDVFWPGKLFEELVPRLENLDELNLDGVQATKALMKSNLRKRVLDVLDEETKALVKCWTNPSFAKNLRIFLRTADHITFQ